MTSINIYGTLYTAKQGMAAQQAGLSITGQNVANVNTEGYSRQRAQFASLPGSAGVEVVGIRRYTDEFANSRLIEEESLLGNAQQRSMILSHVSDLFNDLENAGLGTALDNFFGSLRQLQSSPHDPTARQEVLARGKELSNTFNRIAGESEIVRYNVNNILKASASEVNIRTEEIAKLNQEISFTLTQGGDASDLLDRRDQLLREIAEHVRVTHLVNDNGQMTVFLEGGRPLVDGNNQSSLRVNDSGGAAAAGVEYVAANGHVTDITSMIQSGSMGGALQVRDQILPGYSDQLNQLAYDVAVAVNAQHAAGFGLDGVGGRDFFIPLASSANAAALIDLDAAVEGNTDAIAAAEDPTMLPGDNRNALALAGLADLPLAASGALTFDEGYAMLVGEIGVAARQAVDESSLRETSINHVETLRDRQAGVSLDEEMANLIQYQRAYQASARVLSVIDRIIETLLNMR